MILKIRALTLLSVLLNVFGVSQQGEVKCSFQPRRGGFVQWMIAMKAINEIRCHAVLENSPIFYENYGVFLCVAKVTTQVDPQELVMTYQPRRIVVIIILD